MWAFITVHVFSPPTTLVYDNRAKSTHDDEILKSLVQLAVESHLTASMGS